MDISPYMTEPTDILDKPSVMSGEGVDLLKKIETLRLTPYDDQTGKDITSWVEGATIGYGHLISKKEWKTFKNGITKSQAGTLLGNDLAPVLKDVRNGITSLVTQYQFDAAVFLRFNIGNGGGNVDGFSNSSALKLMNNPNASTNYNSLESAWKAWNKSQGSVNNGLINRRAAEWDMYSKSTYRQW